MLSGRKTILLIISTVITQLLSAQSDNNLFQNTSVGIKGYKGVFLARGTRAQYIKDSYPEFFEINIAKQTDGSKAVHLANNLPKYGFGLVYGNLGSKNYIGKTAALFSFIDVPVLRSKIYQTNLRLGSGVGWIEKPFDVETNHKNLSLGSHFNVYINIGIENEIKIFDRLHLNTSLAYMHLSNGKVKLPNLGVDMVFLSLGARYHLSDTIKMQKTHFSKVNNKINFTLYGYVGRKQTPFIGSPQYTITSLSAEFLKPLNHFANLAAGIGIIHDPSIINAEKHSRQTNLQGVAFAGYEHKFGKVSVPLHFGYYLYNKPESKSYKSFGLRYKLNERLNVGTYLKFHSLNADFLYAGLGYKF